MPPPATLEFRCHLPDGREITLARGHCYRLNDGRQVLITALQIGARGRAGAQTTLRLAWTSDSTATHGEVGKARFLELVAEELPA